MHFKYCIEHIMNITYSVCALYIPLWVFVVQITILRFKCTSPQCTYVSYLLRHTRLFCYMHICCCTGSFFTGLTGSDVTCNWSLVREQFMITSVLLRLLSISMLKTLGHNSATLLAFFFIFSFFNAVHSCTQVPILTRIHTHAQTLT